VLLGTHRDEHKSAAPRHSPGLVRSDELVLRTILDPDHIEPGGGLKSAAISLDDLRFRGWSVDRKRYTSLRQLRLFHSRWAARKPQVRQFLVIPVLVSEIRIDRNGLQDFVVTDAAQCSKPCHANVLSSVPKLKDSEVRKLRDELIKRLPRYVKAEDVFGESDRYGYLRGMLAQSVVFFLAFFRLRGRGFFFSGR
jgi:hypothetical protein